MVAIGDCFDKNGRTGTERGRSSAGSTVFEIKIQIGGQGMKSQEVGLEAREGMVKTDPETIKS